MGSKENFEVQRWVLSGVLNISEQTRRIGCKIMPEMNASSFGISRCIKKYEISIKSRMGSSWIRLRASLLFAASQRDSIIAVRDIDNIDSEIARR
eukprot:3807494-Pleurochrysis_carterae.AAC.1